MSCSLLGFSWWSPVTNKCLQGGAFCDIYWFSRGEMQLLARSSLSLTKQTLPTKKIPGCLAPAPTTHQTWPDIREEVLQGTGRASLIRQRGGRRQAVWVLCLNFWHDSCSYVLALNEPNWEQKKEGVVDHWNKNKLQNLEFKVPTMSLSCQFLPVATRCNEKLNPSTTP